MSREAVVDHAGEAPTRRDRILDAALAAFDERGYEATTIADVRARSGASVGSIYHRFADKQGLAAAVYVECLRDYQVGLAETLAHGPDAEQGIRAVVRHHLAWVEANPSKARFLFERREPEVATASAAAVRELNEELFEAVRGWLRPQIDAGRIREMSLLHFYVIVIGPSQEYARHWLRDPQRKPIGRDQRALAEAAWRAVRADAEGD